MQVTECGQKIEVPEEIRQRLGVSIEFAREHQGPHRRIDGRRYLASCIVADPDCDAVARSYLARGGAR